MGNKKKFDPLNRLFTLRNGNKTVTFGLFSDPGSFDKIIPFAGVAVRSPDDKENSKRATRISTGDAYRNLGRSILKEEYYSIAQQGMGIYTKVASRDILFIKKHIGEIEKSIGEIVDGEQGI